jgi:hypothetical protein
VFAATHLEFILAYNPPNFSYRIPPKENLALLRASLSKAYPVPAAPHFDELVVALNDADEEMMPHHESLTIY